MEDNKESRGWIWLARIADAVGLGTFLWLIVKWRLGEEPWKDWSPMQFSSHWIDWVLLIVGSALLLGRRRWWRGFNVREDSRRWENYPFTEVRGETFARVTVKLDGYKYNGCRFEDVTFEYQGTAPFEVINANITAPHLGKRIMTLRTSHPIVACTQAFIRDLDLVTGSSR